MCRRLLISASGLEHIHRFRAADSVRATTDRNGTVQIYCPHKIFLLFTKFSPPEMSGWNAHMSRRGPHRRQKYLFSPRASEQSTTTPPRPRPTNTPAPAAPLLIVWPPPSIHPSPAEAVKPRHRGASLRLLPLVAAGRRRGQWESAREENVPRNHQKRGENQSETEAETRALQVAKAYLTSHEI